MLYAPLDMARSVALIESMMWHLQLIPQLVLLYSCGMGMPFQLQIYFKATTAF